jgi:hypothetical protein
MKKRPPHAFEVFIGKSIFHVGDAIRAECVKYDLSFNTLDSIVHNIDTEATRLNVVVDDETGLITEIFRG